MSKWKVDFKELFCCHVLAKPKTFLLFLKWAVEMLKLTSKVFR